MQTFFKRNLLIFHFFFLSSFIFTAYPQNGPSSYYRNFVRHANGDFCLHTPPEASFTCYLNRDQSRVLIENAPQWQPSDPNIAGNGTFGVELGNFANPPLAVGDSVFVRFTCNVTEQQGVLADSVSGIPWQTFPANLYLAPVTLPEPPQNVALHTDTSTYHRTIRWTQVAGMTYSVYRRAYSDTLPDGRPRMVYHRIAQNINDSLFIDINVLATEKYGYLVYATSGQGVTGSHSQEVNEDPYVPPGSDLTVMYIARLPRLNYVWGSSNPAEEGWPVPGQTVRWRAVVRNWLDSTLTGVPYQWVMNGNAVDSGAIDIAAGDTASVDYPWSWTFNRNQLKFVIDPQNVIPEEEEENNELLIYTDAISAGLYVEQSVYDYFHQYQKELGVHSNSWEDWAQRQVRIWNDMFEDAVYPLSPDGVLDRIRLDKITIVPDGALPLHGGLPSNHPNRQDSTVDLQWGFPATLLNGNFYANHTSATLNNPFYYEGSLIHELGHARYLIDVYGFNIHTGAGDSSVIAIKENGELIVGTPYMPLQGGAVHWSPFQGLMHSNYTYVDEYSTAALNLIEGHRATYGNFNSPGNIGVYLQDLPAENRLTVKDDAGNILPNASVWIYRSESQPGVWYGKFYDDIADIQLTTDANGQVLLGRCPFDDDGTIEHTYGRANGVIIIRVEHNNWIGYDFLEATAFNMEYWAGNTQMAGYEIEVDLVEPTGLADGEDATLPDQFALLQNYPNPFNPETIISYRLPVSSEIELSIYNLLGQKVRTLVSKRQPAGQYEINWDGRDERGEKVSGGIYFYRLSAYGISQPGLTAGDFRQTRKMILMR